MKVFHSTSKRRNDAARLYNIINHLKVKYFLSAIFHSSMNLELFKKHFCNQSSHYENTDGGMCPRYINYCLKEKYPLCFLLEMINSSTNQELFEKHLCNQSSHCEKYRQFPLCKGSHHVLPLNQQFLQSAKMNGTQRKTVVRSQRIHCTYCGKPKGTSQAEATLNSQACSLHRFKVLLI